MSTTGCCFCFGSFSSFFLELFLHSFPVAYWAPTDLGSSSSASYLFVFILFVEFHDKDTEEDCRSLLQWTTFCQNFPPWPVCLGWCYKAWFIVSLSYTRLWSMWSDWLVFCDCGFQPVYLLMEKDKRLMEVCWWERLTDGETGSCSDGRVHA